MSGWSLFKAAFVFVETQAGWLLAGGLGVAAILHGFRWWEDKRRIRKFAPEMGEVYNFGETPSVSILLPAWNEADNVGACMESVLNLRYPNKQLVVCAGGGDNTLEIAKGYEGQRVIVLEQRAGEGKQGALRRCFERATGEVIFLTDADCQLDDECFERTLAPVIAGREDVTTGSWRPLERQVEHPFVQYQWAHHIYREVRLPAYVPTLDGRNAVVRRQALETTGAFQGEAPIGTDYVLSKQLTAGGRRIRFVRQSRVQTGYPETIKAYWKQQSRWFRNPLVLGKRWGERALALTHLRAGFAAVFLLAVPMVGGLGSKLLWYPWMAAVCHLILSQVRLIRFAQLYGGLQLTPRWRYALFLPYMVIGWIAMARGLIDSLLPWHRERW
ncbi:MAG: glycosyltransferase family 2 protein [Anaerolineae bacterium]